MKCAPIFEAQTGPFKFFQLTDGSSKWPQPQRANLPPPICLHTHHTLLPCETFLILALLVIRKVTVPCTARPFALWLQVPESHQYFCFFMYVCSFRLPLPPLHPPPSPCAEKEKRVKSGSDGEGASNSQSEGSASLGSLKGGGESCPPSSRLSLSVIAVVASGGGEVGGGGVSATCQRLAYIAAAGQLTTICVSCLFRPANIATMNSK